MAVPVGINGKYSIVDKDDYDRTIAYNWCDDGHGYAINNSVGYMHSFIMNMKKGEILDHINHNTLDNRKSNLRPCKNKENIMNMRSRGGTSNFKGVYLDKRNNKWISRIQINYKSIYI